MMKRVMTLAVAQLTALALVAPIVEAHEPASWYPQGTFSEDRDRAAFHFDSGFPRGRFRDRVVRAARSWNRLNGRFSFEAHRTTISDGLGGKPSKCTRTRRTENFESFIYWRRIDGRTKKKNTLARAGACVERDAQGAPLAGGLQWFTMAFDREERWYSGRGDPPDDANDASSVATHEFGHATGFSPHFDTGQTSFCPVNKGQHTMCKTNFRGTTWQRSLERHDRHTFEGAY